MKILRKRSLAIGLLLTLLFALGITPAFAAEDAIPSIDIDVLLQPSGNAVITETWDVRGVYEGTEYYKELENMKDMRVHSLTVWDEAGVPYTALEQWDTKRTREQKAGTSGIQQTSKGYELCWGIGSYGDHQYTIEYTIDGLVKDYGDYAGFYHRFVDAMSSPPQSVTIRIGVENAALSADNARIWGYGYGGGVNIADDGSLVAFTDDALDDSDYVNVLARFDRAMFPQAVGANKTFEALQKDADRQNSNADILIAMGVLAAAFVAAVGLTAFFVSRYKLADGSVVRLREGNHLPMVWSIPFDGSLTAIYTATGLLRRGITPQALMGAYLIRWQAQGIISIEERQVQRGKKKPKTEEAVVFHPAKVPAQGVEYTLHQLLISFADSEGILWGDESEKWGEKLYEALGEWADEVKSVGEAELMGLGAVAVDKKGKLRFTAQGFDQSVDILGLKKYLKGMNKYGARHAGQKQLWGDYLVFAVLFDMGEQVLGHMKAVDPEYYDDFSRYYGYDAYGMTRMMNMTGHVTQAASPNTDGTGGSASSSGGGGFSGGGGGGSR